MSLFTDEDEIGMFVDTPPGVDDMSLIYREPANENEYSPSDTDIPDSYNPPPGPIYENKYPPLNDPTVQAMGVFLKDAIDYLSKYLYNNMKRLDLYVHEFDNELIDQIRNNKEFLTNKKKKELYNGKSIDISLNNKGVISIIGWRYFGDSPNSIIYILFLGGLSQRYRYSLTVVSNKGFYGAKNVPKFRFQVDYFNDLHRPKESTIGYGGYDALAKYADLAIMKTIEYKKQ